mmetsp:Transcript_112107/g.267391  ORF Transcript_112107/g.267391 Transcript_112107/m.267391 type:complete len:251 (-) Transcript_112107:108-860(-)
MPAGGKELPGGVDLGKGCCSHGMQWHLEKSTKKTPAQRGICSLKCLRSFQHEGASDQCSSASRSPRSPRHLHEQEGSLSQQDVSCWIQPTQADKGDPTANCSGNARESGEHPHGNASQPRRLAGAQGPPEREPPTYPGGACSPKQLRSFEHHGGSQSFRAFGSCQGLQKGQHEDQGHIQAERRTVERLMPDQLQQSTAARACPDGADGYPGRERSKQCRQRRQHGSRKLRSRPLNSGRLRRLRKLPGGHF